MTKNWIDEVKFNSNGLVPVVTQDFESGRVLMLAWANAEALHEAQVTGRGVYFSRSRGKLWRKGEESGNVQKLQRALHRYASGRYGLPYRTRELLLPQT